MKKLSLILVLALVCVFIFISCAKPSITSKTPSPSPSLQPSKRLPQYSDIELLNLSGHPRVHSSFQATKQFYESIGDDRVKVVSIREYAMLQRSYETFSDNNVLIYYIEHTQPSGFIGTIHINLFGEDLYSDMNVDRAISLLISYLPKDFLNYYKADSSFQYAGNRTTVYAYSCRLTNEGIEYCKNGHPEYSYYYSFKIFHREKEERWSIETDYSAYAGKTPDWIKNYATPWDFKFPQ